MQGVDPVRFTEPTPDQLKQMTKDLNRLSDDAGRPYHGTESPPRHLHIDLEVDPRDDETPVMPRWGVVPTPEELQPFIRGALAAVFARVVAAGLRYGEEVLFIGGELVSAAQVFTDACRILYGVKEDPGGECLRDDSWLDLAGYAIIELARRAYERGEQPGDIDGLFDR